MDSASPQPPLPITRPMPTSKLNSAAAQSSQDLSPLAAQRAWEGQSERNVLDRLTQAGLLANPSDFDQVLETVTNNLILGSNLALPGDVHCRVLLTTDLESLAVGNTIILSKGLIDVLPGEEDLAAMLSFQLAHIRPAPSHRHALRLQRPSLLPRRVHA